MFVDIYVGLVGGCGLPMLNVCLRWGRVVYCTFSNIGKSENQLCCLIPGLSVFKSPSIVCVRVWIHLYCTCGWVWSSDVIILYVCRFVNGALQFEWQRGHMCISVWMCMRTVQSITCVVMCFCYPLKTGSADQKWDRRKEMDVQILADLCLPSPLPHPSLTLSLPSIPLISFHSPSSSQLAL